MASKMLARVAAATSRASTSPGMQKTTTNFLRAFRTLPKLQQVFVAQYIVSSKHSAVARGYATATTTTTTRKKTVKKSVSAKKKAAPKKVAKKVAKKVVKKKKTVILTPKQKTQKRVKELRALLLKPPKMLPQTAWNLFVAKNTKTAKLDKSLADRYKHLAPIEREVSGLSLSVMF
jgi:hypothetical protein